MIQGFSVLVFARMAIMVINWKDAGMNLVRSVRKRFHTFRSWMVNPETLSLTEAQLKLASRRNKDLDFMADRRQEVMDFYHLTPETLDQVLHEAHPHDHLYDDEHDHHAELTINPTFDSDKNLFDHYRQNDVNAAASHMCFELPYYRTALKLLQHLNCYFPPKMHRNITVMDYGCGSADYGLAFATQGYHIRLVDLSGGPIHFASWRFEQRGLPYTAIEISEDNLYPDLGQNHIVLAPEVLEHIRNPLKLVQNMERSIPAGGFFWTSGFPVVEREIGADHLPEAAALRLETLAYLETNFKRVTTFNLPGFLYRKK
jgi:2-polyprenyl-3-methyl-5-hydroxy-6-metoxy-1,4-benzoquinol methylase